MKISELPVLTEAKGTAVIPVVQDGVTMQITKENLVDNPVSKALDDSKKYTDSKTAGIPDGLTLENGVLQLTAKNKPVGDGVKLSLPAGSGVDFYDYDVNFLGDFFKVKWNDSTKEVVYSVEYGRFDTQSCEFTESLDIPVPYYELDEENRGIIVKARPDIADCGITVGSLMSFDELSSIFGAAAVPEIFYDYKHRYELKYSVTLDLSAVAEFEEFGEILKALLYSVERITLKWHNIKPVKYDTEG